MKFKKTLTTLSTIIALAMMPIFTFSQNKGSTVAVPNATTGFSTFSVPQNLGAPVNSVDTELLPVAAPNGLSLYFTSNRAMSLPMVLDIWVSQRPTLSAAWGTPQLVGGVNTTSNESITSISPDGREMFIQSNRTGTLGGQDIYLSTRTDPNDDFGWTTPVNLGAVINTTFDDSLASYFVNPATGIGTLYFSSDRTPTLGSRDVYQSTRNADGTFNAPTPVSELNSSGDDSRLAIRRDGLELFFSSTRLGLPTGFVIFTSTRASVSSPWSPPVPVAALNSASSNSQPALSPDGSILYFVSNRPGGIGPAVTTGDLYSAATRNFCVPTTTVTEGDLASGGIVSFGVTSGQNSVTVDHVNGGTGLQSLTVVGMTTNATVNIPPFTPGTFNPIMVTFTPTMPGQMVDFTLRAASTFHAANIRVRCAETCTPTTTVTEGDLFPGGIVSFGVMSGPGSVTVDHVNAGTGLQSLTVVGVPTNAVVFIPAFTPGIFDPLDVTFSVIDPTQPVDFTLRAASTFHAVNIRVRCAVAPPNLPEK